MNYLLDTNIVSAVLSDEPGVSQRVMENPSSDEKYAVSIITFGEVWYGLKHMTPGRRRNRYEVRASTVFQSLEIELVTVDVGSRYSDIKADLRKRIQLIPDADIWIAATALAGGYVLVTRDAHFSRIPELVIENW